MSRGQGRKVWSGPFFSDTSPKSICREGLGEAVQELHVGEVLREYVFSVFFEHFFFLNHRVEKKGQIMSDFLHCFIELMLEVTCT